MIYHIRNFLTLAITEPVYPLSIEGRIEPNENEPKNVDISVGIFYRLLHISELCKDLTSHDMLFTFKDVSEDFGSFLRNWFTKAELLEPVYDLYFGTLYNPGQYLTNQFLNLVQAIESYHRRTVGNNELPEEDHRIRIAEILITTPANHKEWLKEELKWSNELSLRKRLKSMLKSCPEALRNAIENEDLFINRTIDTRNYWTHFDPSLKEKVAEKGELYKLTSLLGMLLQSCLLKELGFSSESIDKLLSSLLQKKYQFLKQTN
jgi:hypothetical protein